MRGTVSDRITQATVPGVLVSLWTLDDRTNPLGVTTTDDNGGFDVLAPSATGVRAGDGVALDDARGYVLRVHRSADGGAPSLRVSSGSLARGVEFGEPLAVVHVSSFTDRSVVRPKTIWVDDAFGERRRYFARLLAASGTALARVAVNVADSTGAAPSKPGAVQQVTTDTGGFLAVSYPVGGDTAQGPSRAWTTFDGQPLAADWKASPDEPETILSLADPGAFTLVGTLTGATGTAVAGLDLEVLDRSGTWSNPVATTRSEASGEFSVTFPQWLVTPPDPTVVVSSGGRRLTSLDVAPRWKDGGLLGVTVPVGASTVQTLNGTVLHRVSRQPVPGMRIELWVAESGLAGSSVAGSSVAGSSVAGSNQAAALALRQVATSGNGGTFTLAVPAAGGVDAALPVVVLRLFAGSIAAGEVTIDARTLRTEPAVVFVETDVVPPIEVARIHGRLVDSTSRAPLPALRVEVWDRSPRVGGMIGVSTFAAADGGFELAVPVADAGALAGGTGAGGAATPSVFFRVYAGDGLVGTTDGEVSWASDGAATAVVAVSPAVTTTDDVVLHELGETLAGTVNRMQNELNRYPSTMGAFLVDELDLTVPVAVRLDGLGQVRTRVLEQAPADGSVGQVRMRVRPVVGGNGGTPQQLAQPLTALKALSPSAIAALNARRLYSVEDLARLASTAAGREALADLRLGVDLDALIDVAALLATPLLPLRVREELVRLGVPGLRAFAGADAADLAAGLAVALAGETAQPVSEDDVTAWQKAVRHYLVVPLPSDDAG